MEVRLGNIFGFTGGNYAGNVYSKDHLSPTLNTMQGGCKQPMIVETNQIPKCLNPKGGRSGIDGLQPSVQDRVYSVGGISTSITTSFMPSILEDKTIVAMRGRNPTNPSDRTPGIELEQTLEVNQNGTSNCLTSVQKDNLVLENCIDLYNKSIRQDECVGTLTTNSGTQFHCGSMGIVETVKIKQATSQGYIECEVGGVADFSYPDSKTRRGRVQENGQVSQTIMAGEQDICRIEKEVEYEEEFSFEILRILRREIGEKDFSEWSIRGLWCVLQEEILRQNVYAKGIYENWTHRPELFKFAYNSKGNKYSIHSEKSMRNMWEEWTVRCTPQRRGLSEQQCREFDDFMSKLPYEATQRKRFVYCLWKTSEGIGLLREALSEIQKVWEPTNYQEMQQCIYRIRKLTPLSCWRLMDFTDEDFEKAAEVNSNTQLYKQAGNSIVKNVLIAIFGQMIPGKGMCYLEEK